MDLVDGPPSLPRQPRLRHGFAVIPMADGTVQLRLGDERISVLEGTAVRALGTELLSWFDGTHSYEEIIEELGKIIGPDQALISVQELMAGGFLEDAASWPVDCSDAEELTINYLTSAGLSAAEVVTKLRKTQICVTGHSEFSRVMLANIQQHGFSRVTKVAMDEAVVREALSNSDLIVYTEERRTSFCDSTLNPLAVETGTPWLYCSLAPGYHAILGPLFVPGKTCCFACYQARIRINTNAHQELTACEKHVRQNGDILPSVKLPAHQTFLASLAAMEVMKFLFQHHSSGIINRSRTFDLMSEEQWSEPVWRLPGCSTCSRKT